MTTTTTDKDGNVTSIDDYSPTGALYDTTDNKPETIDFDGKTYTFVAVQDGDVESAQVVEGVTHVTYIYDVVKTVKTFHIYEPVVLNVVEISAPVEVEEDLGNGSTHFITKPGEYSSTRVELDPILWLEEDGTQPSRVEEFTDEYNAFKSQYSMDSNPSVIEYSGLYYSRTVVDDEGNTYHYYTNDSISPESPGYGYDVGS